jgi:hypothetical protein
MFCDLEEILTFRIFEGFRKQVAWDSKFLRGINAVCGGWNILTLCFSDGVRKTKSENHLYTKKIYT